jgi:hypothetical protein
MASDESFEKQAGRAAFVTRTLRGSGGLQGMLRHMDELVSDRIRWPHTDRAAHSLQLYAQDDELTDALARFAGAALGAGDSVIIIATPEHRKALRARLGAHALDIATAVREGRYWALDASETLAQFMIHGHPDHKAFMEVAGALITRAAERASDSGRHVAAFGEMVALLAAEGNIRGALELEALWNELAKTYRFYLHCAYPSALFLGAGDLAPLAEVCGQHSHVVNEIGELGMPETPDDRFRVTTIVREQLLGLVEELDQHGR